MPASKWSAVGRPDRPRILLIEDNITQLDLYALVLEERYEVLRATLGEQGYTIACEQRPDAIVVDILLPDVDGLALCERFHSNARTAAAPKIVLTGDDAAYERALAVRHLDAVRKKPCPGDELLAVLEWALTARQVN